SIEFSVPEASDVTLEVFNMQGQRVATLVNGSMSAGTHRASFDAANLSSGIYLYRMTAGNFTATNKMMLVK
ncbi:MAG: T9SS type A sorting domain-containing protein, partial [Cyclonatronaceae bacterium]